MNKSILIIAIIFCMLLPTGCSKEGDPGMLKFTNPIAEHGNDPWIVMQGGYYYYCYSESGGIRVSKMKNFIELGEAKAERVWTAPGNTIYSKEIWAPELHYLNGEWYIYFAADDGNNDNHKMYVLKGTSQDPTEQFEFVGVISDSSNKWAIDGTVMQYKDELYFVWSGWEGYENIKQDIYIAKMSDPCTISSERVMISTPDLFWEKYGDPKINEGPVAISHDGTMHIVYSASASWLNAYCLGLLTLKNGEDPLVAENWVKADRPILRESATVFGPGHCSFTTVMNEGEEEIWVVYHANVESGSGWGGRKVFTQKVEWDENNYPVIGEPVDAGVELTIAENK